LHAFLLLSLAKILKAVVENCRFQSQLANEMLVDRIKVIAADPMTNPQVKKTLLFVLQSWKAQFKDDPSMRAVAGLYNEVRVRTAGLTGNKVTRVSRAAGTNKRTRRNRLG
jgi:hypothetical protein